MYFGINHLIISFPLLSRSVVVDVVIVAVVVDDDVVVVSLLCLFGRFTTA